MNGKKGINIMGGEIVQTLEGVNKGAELDTLGDGKPMKLIQERRGMSAFRFFENKPGTPVLNSLKTGHILLRDAIEQSTTIVQP